MRSAAIWFTSGTLGALPSVLAKIIAGVTACLARDWRVFVRLYSVCKFPPIVSRVLGKSRCGLLYGTTYKKT
ncbi:MAG: hypothetical protein EZS28_040587 [Streblomastix strix]|uniref:Uncharacterized protein n=1 Tax=Streblomastix strix TaxID=222440 RepID=A0A5J4U032_9EUKA|nr:MAG: hypothetical protein EZS28_040587 [Streblomastix strix]